MMKLVDEDIGRIIDLLKELDIDENTFVLITSDNGPHYEEGTSLLFLTAMAH